MGVLASVLVGYIPAPRLWFVSKSCHVSRARACTLLGKMAAATPSPLKRSRRAEANEAPPVPDVGQAWGADFVAGAAAELRDDQLVGVPIRFIYDLETFIGLLDRQTLSAFCRKLEALNYKSSTMKQICLGLLWHAVSLLSPLLSRLSRAGFS